MMYSVQLINCVRISEVNFVCMGMCKLGEKKVSVNGLPQGPRKLSVITRCPYVLSGCP